MDAICQALPEVLLPWYAEHKRQLPWRQDRQPYHVWVSEIMLQQTRVEAVKGYYIRFLAALPTIEALACCDDDVLHKLWEGLGYYSRVRNLKKAAVMIVEQYGGVFPGEYEKIRALPGIGAYTAGAICSICFDRPTPAVDGNVLRVISRLTDDATPVDLPAYKNSVRQSLVRIYPAQAGDFTQALMELGATVCGPDRKPDCQLCPCRDFCLGYQRGTAENLPMRLPKKQRRNEEKTVLILSCQGRYALRKRQETGLLAGLWQFPDLPGKMEVQQVVELVEAMGMGVTQVYRSIRRKHIFTHVQWQMHGVYLEVSQQGGDFSWLTAEEINTQAALPTAYRLFWDEI